MLISKTIDVVVNKSNIKYYTDLGFTNIKCSDVIEVDVNKLSKGCHAMIKCACDYCGKEIHMMYKTYNRNMSSITKKLACRDCLGKKTRETSMEKYGVPSAMCLKTTQEKAQQTTFLHYGVNNPLQNDEIKEKIKQTNIERHGVEYPSQSPKIRKKIEESVFNHYGVSHILQSPEIQDKISKTISEKYGVENISQSEEIKQKKKETLMKHYGVEYSSQSPEIREKIRQTYLKHYGVEYGVQSQEVRKKVKETLLRNYGVEYCMCSPLIREKVVKTLYKNQSVMTSSQQKYICSLFQMELNYPVKYYNVDMCDIESKLICEYDGGGHRLNVEMGVVSDQEFDHKEIVRNNVIKKEGYKMMRIISTKDKLPTDDKLLEILAISRDYFHKYPNHSWIEFDIDKSCMRNAENSNGVPFDFGETKVYRNTVSP